MTIQTISTAQEVENIINSNQKVVILIDDHYKAHDLDIAKIEKDIVVIHAASLTLKERNIKGACAFIKNKVVTTIELLSKPIFEANLNSLRQQSRSPLVNLGDNNFDAFINAHQLIVLNFTASWCGPCKIVKPKVEELAAKNPSVIFGIVDIDNAQNTSSKFGIASVPTFIGLNNKVQRFRFAGTDITKLNSLVETLKLSTNNPSSKS